MRKLGLLLPTDWPPRHVSHTIVDAANLLTQEVSMAWLVGGVDRGSNVTGI